MVATLLHSLTTEHYRVMPGSEFTLKMGIAITLEKSSSSVLPMACGTCGKFRFCSAEGGSAHNTGQHHHPVAVLSIFNICMLHMPPTGVGQGAKRLRWDCETGGNMKVFFRLVSHW